MGSVFATTASHPTFIAFGPRAVPEPSSLILMGIGGLAGLAYAALRRSKQA